MNGYIRQISQIRRLPIRLLLSLPLLQIKKSSFLKNLIRSGKTDDLKFRIIKQPLEIKIRNSLRAFFKGVRVFLNLGRKGRTFFIDTKGKVRRLTLLLKFD